jgi:hypothetical protein
MAGCYRPFFSYQPRKLRHCERSEAIHLIFAQPIKRHAGVGATGRPAASTT